MCMCVLRVYSIELLLLSLSVPRDSLLSDDDGYPRALEKNLTLTGGGHTGSPSTKNVLIKNRRFVDSARDQTSKEH